MTNKHLKLRKELSTSIFYLVMSLVLLIIALSSRDIGVIVLFCGICLWFLYGWVCRTVSIILDLREQPVEIEGNVTRKYFNDPNSDDSIYPCYKIYINDDPVGLECDAIMWELVDESDRVKISYHINSKYIENTEILEKQAKE